MKKNLLIILSVIGAAGLASVQAQLINVNFTDDGNNSAIAGNNPDVTPTPPGTVMTGAAVIGSAGDFWNDLGGFTYASASGTEATGGAASASGLALTNADGSASPVTLSLSAPGGTYGANAEGWGNHSAFSWASLAAETAQTGGPWTPYSALMSHCLVAYLGPFGNVTLTGLTPNGAYTLYAYSASDQNVGTGRASYFTVNGVTQISTWNGTQTNLVQGVDYVEFASVAADGTGTLVINFGSSSSSEGDFDGFQLLPNMSSFPLAANISGFSPNGSQFFNIASNNFSFNVVSSSANGYPLPTIPTNWVTLLVNGVNQSGSLQFSNNGTVGTSTNWYVTFPLTPNQIYTMSVTVSNSAGLVANSGAVKFDTFSPIYIVTAEEYDFSNGMYIQNPIPTTAPATNSYFGTAGILGVDLSTGGGAGGLGGGPQSYRTDGDVSLQVSTDTRLPLYLAQGMPNMLNLAYNNPGNWENYTRNPYPQGNCLMYARMADGAGAVGYEYLNLLTNGYGMPTQATNNLGVFITPATGGWQNYAWVPLTDINGNVIVLSVPPGQQTLQLLSGGNNNFIDFMFVALPSGGLPPAIQTPIAVPFGNVFLGTNITFTVSSISSTIATNNVQILLNGVPASATFTGNNTNWNVSIPVPLKNQIQTLVVNAKDAYGLTNSITESFDTFSQNNYMFEAEDFDFNGGQFIDNPIPTGTIPYAAGSYTATNSYFFYPAGNSDNAAIFGEDLTTPGTAGGENFQYRPAELAGTQVATDFLRQKFYVTNGVTVTIFSDFNVGWWNPGEWLNYTRTFPTNTYNVYGRLASGGAYSGDSLSLVTSGVGTPTQTTMLLGTFSDPNANGWGNWHWVPLLNTNGQLAVVSLGGVETLQAQTGLAGLNANYYMLVPAVVAPQAVHLSVSRTGSTISIQFPTQSGFSYTVLYSGSLNPANWLTLTTISGDGTVKTATDTMGSSPRFYRVSFQ